MLAVSNDAVFDLVMNVASNNPPLETIARALEQL
jgi:hypothetical protein